MTGRDATRPRVPMARGQWALLVVALLGLLALQLIGLVRYPSLPDPLPGHYGSGGVVDRWDPLSPASAFGPLWIGLAIALGIGTLVLFLDRMPQHFGSSPLTGAAHVRSTRAVRWFLSAMAVALAVLFARSALGTWAGADTTSPWWSLLPLGVTAVGIPWCIVDLGRSATASDKRS